VLGHHAAKAQPHEVHGRDLDACDRCYPIKQPPHQLTHGTSAQNDSRLDAARIPRAGVVHGYLEPVQPVISKHGCGRRSR